MMTRIACRNCLSLAAVVAFVATALAAPLPEKPPAPSTSDKIRKELDRIISVELTEQNLESGLNLLREQTKLNLVLDRFTLAQSGVDASEFNISNVTFRDTKARDALQAVLTPYNLHWVIVGDTVLVTTEEMAVYRQLKQRVKLDLDQVEFAVAVKRLARDTGVSMVLDPRAVKDAQTKVTLQAEDLPLESAIRILSELAGLKPVRMGNALFITTRASAAELRSEPELAAMPRATGALTEAVNFAAAGGVVRAVPAMPVPAAVPVAPPPPPPAPAVPPPATPAPKP
jgi:hypothetical protein